MKHILVGVGLFILQIYFTLRGVILFGKYVNPVFLLAVSAAIPAYLVWVSLNQANKPIPQKTPGFLNRSLWASGGLLSILVAYEELRKVFVKYNEPEKWSDVIAQVRTLYERFSHGEFPYKPIEIVGSHILQPVYMPLHWLPAGLAVLLHMDLRWIGFGFLALASAFYGWRLAGQPHTFWSRMIALVLPSLPLWAFIIWGPIDISVSYEIIIGAYYLLLATGLLAKRLWLVTLGIIVCFLSRYTLVCWLPLFVLLLLYEKGWKKSILVWGAVAVCFITFYILPFYTKDPTMLSRGLSYYVGATVAEWKGYGDPPVSWSHEQGISFAPHMKAFFSGDMAHKVYSARIVQSVLLLLVFISVLWAYRRWRNRIDWFTYSLIALYCFLMVYYFFAPLTYRYYMFSFLIFSAVLCGKILEYGLHEPDKEGNNIN